MARRNGHSTHVRPPVAADRLAPLSHDAVEWECVGPERETPSEPVVEQTWFAARHRAAALLGCEPSQVDCWRKR